MSFRNPDSPLAPDPLPKENFAKDEPPSELECLEIEAASEVRDRADSECRFVWRRREKVKNTNGTSGNRAAVVQPDG